MNKHIYISIIAAVLASASCSRESLSPDSVIRVSKAEKTPFDEWLEVNFRNPYNIEFKYRYEMNEADFDYFTVPADYGCAIKMAHLVKYLCVDTYDEVATPAFTKSYFPKMFFLIGTWEYNNNGTIILGTAEGGKKIMLSGINELPQHLGNLEELNEFYFKTIHHEFTHILNQNKVYSTDFKMVTANGYVADAWSEAPYNKDYLKRGFITAYSQMADTEDYAEMVSEFITHTPAWWEAQLAEAGEDGARLLLAKLDLIKQYLTEMYGIDIEELRATIIRRENEIMAGYVDLDDITIK